MTQTYLNSEGSCDLTDAPASVYDKKIAALPFDTIHDLSISRNLSSKAKMRQFGASGTKGFR